MQGLDIGLGTRALHALGAAPSSNTDRCSKRWQASGPPAATPSCLRPKSSAPKAHLKAAGLSPAVCCTAVTSSRCSAFRAASNSACASGATRPAEEAEQAELHGPDMRDALPGAAGTCSFLCCHGLAEHLSMLPLDPGPPLPPTYAARAVPQQHGLPHHPTAAAAARSRHRHLDAQRAQRRITQLERAPAAMQINAYLPSCQSSRGSFACDGPHPHIVSQNPQSHQPRPPIPPTMAPASARASCWGGWARSSAGAARRRRRRRPCAARTCAPPEAVGTGVRDSSSKLCCSSHGRRSSSSNQPCEWHADISVPAMAGAPTLKAHPLMRNSVAVMSARLKSLDNSASWRPCGRGRE